MTTQLPLDAAGARITDLLHGNIADLINGNHVNRTEVLNNGSRSCSCHIIYEVDWAFVPCASAQRMQGSCAVSTHFGDDWQAYEAETAHRCEIGRIHKPIRNGFMSQVQAEGGSALKNAGQPVQVWDFGQHSVHVQCERCRGKGRVDCPSCRGSGHENCHRCHGSGSTTETRVVTETLWGKQQSRTETYQQSCYACGGSGDVNCGKCNGSGKIKCGECGGHGFFTDITSVIVQAEPQIKITVQSELLQGMLFDYLVKLPVSSAAQYLDFTLSDHHDTANDTWRTSYEVHTTIVELDIKLRTKNYTAAAIGDKALAFIKPPIFDDVFIEEITDLKKIWSGRKQSFSNDRARKFFNTYAGQPVLDTAMKSVAKLNGKDRETPGLEVTNACNGYISNGSANILGKCITMLLDKISPPNSIWSWIVVMALPFLVLFLKAQNWFEQSAPDGYFGLIIAWIALALIAALLTVLVSPIAATISMMVSAIRRRAVPPEYRQSGRNWQPFKRFVLISIVVASLGGGLGLLTHHDKLPRWNNAPMGMIEAWLKQVGLFGTPPTAFINTPGADQ